MAQQNLMAEADKIMKMLDDMYETNPDEYKKFMEKTLKEGRQEFGNAEFRFCIHAKDSSSVQKHFINICSFSAVSAPKSDQDPISVYGGKGFSEEVGSESVVIDFLGINPKVLDEVGEDKELKKMVIHLAIKFYNDTKKYKLSYDCGVSKKMVGKEHHLKEAFAVRKNRKNPLEAKQPDMADVKLPFQVEETENLLNGIKLSKPKSEAKGNLISEVNSTSRDISFKSEVLTEPKYCLKLKAKVDFINSITDLDLEVVEGVLVLTINDFSVSRHKVPYGERVIEDSAKAKLSKSKVLTITFDLLPDPS